MKLIDVRHALTSFAVLALGALALTACNERAAPGEAPEHVVNHRRRRGTSHGLHPTVVPGRPARPFDRQAARRSSPKTPTARRPRAPGDDNRRRNHGQRRDALRADRAQGRLVRPRPADRHRRDQHRGQRNARRAPRHPGRRQRFGRYYMRITLCGLDCERPGSRLRHQSRHQLRTTSGRCSRMACCPSRPDLPST